MPSSDTLTVAPALPRRTDARRSPDRFIGVDIARFIAIIGMMAAHLWGPTAVLPQPEFASTAASVADVVTNGTASALFAVLGGMSLVLATIRVRERRGTAGVLLSVLARGLVVMVLGMLLGLLPTAIVGVLTYFGLAMILAAPFVIAPSAVVAGAAVVLTVVGGWVNVLIREAVQTSAAGGAVSVLDVVMDPGSALQTTLITGTYPVITWLAYLLVGILIARMLLAARRSARATVTALQFAAAGLVVTLVSMAVSVAVTAQIGTTLHSTGMEVEQLRERLAEGGFGAAPGSELWLQLIASPHTGTPAEIIRNVGISLVIIGLTVAWFDRSAAADATTSWLTRWIQACGAAPLTIYAMHLVVNAVALLLAVGLGVLEFAPWWNIGFGAWALHVGIALLIGLVLLLLRRRGPLEALLALLTRQAVRLAPLVTPDRPRTSETPQRA